MTAPALERRYRRLLACYPAEHRRNYGEEMIGVLLASAASSQRRPGVADTLDLIGGGARVRLRKALTGTPDPGWCNALAMVTLVAPILAAALAEVVTDWFALPGWQYGTGSGKLTIVAVALVPLTLGLLKLRRLAALAATATVALVAVAAGTSGELSVPSVSAFIVLLAVQAFAFWVSAGPRRALTLVTPTAVVIAIPWFLTAAYMARLIPTHYPIPLVVAKGVIAVAAAAGLAALATSGGRRLVALIAAIPLSGMVITILTFANVSFYAMAPASRLLGLYLPPLALASLTFIVARRSGNNAEPPHERAVAA
jgi:hypothetical protein